MPRSFHLRPSGESASRRLTRPRLRAFAMVAAPIVVAALVSGCGGGGSSPGVANVSASKTSTSHTPSTNGGGGSALAAGGPSSSSGGNSHEQTGFELQAGDPQDALKFSECMRTNGVPNFPDPNGQGVIRGDSSEGLDPTSPAFQKASKACAKDIHHVAPSPAQIAQREAAALSFSKCMRSHGVTNFPDPQFGSGGSIRISLGRGPGSAGDLDPNSPIFQRAQQDCGSLLPGVAGQKTGAP